MVNRGRESAEEYVSDKATIGGKTATSSDPYAIESQLGGSHSGSYNEVSATGTDDHTTINDTFTGLTAPGTVALSSGDTYELNGTIDMQSGINLVIPHRVILKQNADAPVIEMAPGADVIPDKTVIDVSSSPTPRTVTNIRYDGPTNGPFRTFSTNEDANIWGMFLHYGHADTDWPANEYENSAIRLIGGDTSGTQVTNLQLGHHLVDNMNVGILGDANIGGSGSTGFLNNNFVWMNVNRHKVGMHHRGVGDGKIQVRGHFQASDNSYAINSGSSLLSFRFYGHLEDQHRIGDNVVEGGGIKLNGLSRFNISSTNVNQTLSEIGPGTTFDGVGYEEGTADNPNDASGEFVTGANAGAYFPGECIIYHDTDDGTGDGLYMKTIFEATRAWAVIEQNSALVP